MFVHARLDFHVSSSQLGRRVANREHILRGRHIFFGRVIALQGLIEDMSIVSVHCGRERLTCLERVPCSRVRDHSRPLLCALRSLGCR